MYGAAEVAVALCEVDTRHPLASGALPERLPMLGRDLLVAPRPAAEAGEVSDLRPKYAGVLHNHSFRFPPEGSMSVVYAVHIPPELTARDRVSLHKSASRCIWRPPEKASKHRAVGPASVARPQPAGSGWVYTHPDTDAGLVALRPRQRLGDEDRGGVESVRSPARGEPGGGPRSDHALRLGAQLGVPILAVDLGEPHGIAGTHQPPGGDRSPSP